MSLRVLITGGAGFIGSAVARRACHAFKFSVCVVDKLTYAGNLASLSNIPASELTFYQADICNKIEIENIFNLFRPQIVMHLAAETHVDRSIEGPAKFIEANIVGTFSLLQAALSYWRSLPPSDAARFRLQHISTDEVFGSLGAEGAFREDTPYAPNSPYSASKAASDHLVRAWRETYGLPTLVTNCSNNYGPYQFPEKLIPLIILNATEGKPLPVYGRGDNIRDWLYVDDHADALLLVAKKGTIGESYNVGGRAERSNISVVEAICDILNELRPPVTGSYRELIQFVPDRPGHDMRYAIDCSKIERDLGWTPRETFESGLRKTVQWYLDNEDWWRSIRSGGYRGERLGLIPKAGE